MSDVWRDAIDGAKNFDAEQSVLGGILLRNDVLAELADLGPRDFADPRNLAVFEAVQALDATGKPIDPVTIEAQLASAGKSEAVGGFGYLGDLALRVPTAANVVHYAQILRSHRITRDVLVACSSAPGYAIGERSSGPASGEQLLDEVLGELGRIERPRLESERTTAASAVRDHMLALDRWFEDPSSRAVPSLPWRIRTLDDATGGVPIGRVTTIGARTGVGKSTLLVNFLMRRSSNEPGIVFSNEDDTDEIAVQMLAWESKVDSRRIRDRSLCGSERDAVARAAARVESKLSHVRLVADPTISFAEMWRMVAVDKRRRGTKWAALDYLQNVPRPNARNAQELSKAIGADMQLSQRKTLDLDVAFILVSQLNRAAEDPGKKATRPRLHNLSDSTGIENCSKLVVLPHRDPSRPDNVLEVGIPKNKRGRSGPNEWIDLEVRYEHAFIGDLPSETHDADPRRGAPPRDRHWSNGREDYDR